MQNCMILSTEMIRCCHARCFIAIFSVVVESVAGASVSIHLIRLSLIFICSKIWVFFDRINLGESAWNVCVFDRNNALFVCLFFFSSCFFSLCVCISRGKVGGRQSLHSFAFDSDMRDENQWQNASSRLTMWANHVRWKWMINAKKINCSWFCVASFHGIDIPSNRVRAYHFCGCEIDTTQLAYVLNLLSIVVCMFAMLQVIREWVLRGEDLVCFLLNSFIAYLPCQLHSNVCAAGRRIESNFHFLKKTDFPSIHWIIHKNKINKNNSTLIHKLKIVYHDNSVCVHQSSRNWLQIKQKGWLPSPFSIYG